MNIASAVILCTIVGAVGAIILVAAAKFMAVEEDPRIEVERKNPAPYVLFVSIP